MTRRNKLFFCLADRRVTSFVRRAIVDRWLPPALRDLRSLNAIANRLWLGDVPLDFQREAWGYDEAAWRRIWKAISTSATSTSRESDASEGQIRWVEERVRALAPRSVIEIGAGRGHAAKRILAALPDSATLYISEPFAEPDVAVIPGKRLEILRAEASALPFEDGAIDLAVCLHTLEHVPRLFSTFAEIRRVAKRSLVVVPLQRWSPYTWDLHLHFFPYLEYLPGLLETEPAAMHVIDGDGAYEFVHRH